MAGFVWLDDQVTAMAQLRPEDMAGLARAGVTAVINHRPDDEEAGQPTSVTLAENAAAAGLDYAWIPVRGLPDAGAIAATAQLLADARPEDRFVFFCRSGLRSAAAWASARRLQGVDGQSLRDRAAAAGYDLSRLPL